MSNFEHVDKSQDFMRWLRTVDDTCWVSVLYRMTGFGYMEWETAVCHIDDKGDQVTEIVRGDWRDEVNDMTRDELFEWVKKIIQHNKTSFD